MNKVSIGYGIAPEGGEQPRYVADRPDSVTRYGRHEAHRDHRASPPPRTRPRWGR